MKTRLEKINSYILTCFLFQFGILLPFCLITKNQLPNAVFTAVLILYAAYINSFKINKVSLWIIVGVLVAFIYSFVFFPKNINSGLKVFINFGMKCIPAIYISGLKFDYETIWRGFKRASFVTLLCLAWFPLFTFQLAPGIGYMRFGYAFLPAVLVFFQEMWWSKGEKRIYYLLLFMVSAVLMLMFGSRGTLVCMAIYILMQLIFFENNKKRRIFNFLIIVLVGVILCEGTIPSKLIHMIVDVIGGDTYALRKYAMMFEEGLAASSSGRSIIYADAIARIKNNLIFGSGIGNSITIVKMTNHNLVLQILEEFGVVGIVIFGVLLGCSTFNMLAASEEIKKYFRIIVSMLFSISLGRLFLSSDIWQRPELWMFFTMVLREPLKRK